MSDGAKLSREFFQRDPVTCARELIGCKLVWDRCAGIIVETEAYSAVNDEACHTFFRPSARKFIAEHAPGFAYVYFNYGMYWLLNVLVKGGAEDGFVLIRAIEPIQGISLMQERRHQRSRARGPAILESLCSGPGKLTMALGIKGADHGRDLCGRGKFGFLRAPSDVRWKSGARIGISRAVDLPWRFLAEGSRFISHHRTDRAAR